MGVQRRRFQFGSGICPGTFLDGLIHMGLKHFSGGRINEPVSICKIRRYVADYIYEHHEELEKYKMALLMEKKKK
jgi:tRNA U34 5-carboxymethylaminomethyl modifying enzyme MnmG/GidA